MKPMVRIYEHADIKPLALAVVSQAIRDLKSNDVIKAVDAALWLMGDDFPTWAEIINIPFADGYKLLTSGVALRQRAGKK
jgi:hypothetical protein